MLRLFIIEPAPVGIGTAVDLLVWSVFLGIRSIGSTALLGQMILVPLVPTSEGLISPHREERIPPFHLVHSTSERGCHSVDSHGNKGTDKDIPQVVGQDVHPSESRQDDDGKGEAPATFDVPEGNRQ